MNSLYESYQNQRQQQQGSTGFNLNSALQNVMNFISPYGMDPETFARNLMKNNQMTQAQFESYRQIANQLTGKNL